jgi:hypothetical protein
MTCPKWVFKSGYTLRMILSALSDYDLGYSVGMTAARLKKKTGRSVSTSTINAWLNQYRQHCSYRRLRAGGLNRYPPEQTVRTLKLYHRQVGTPPWRCFERA